MNGMVYLVGAGPGDYRLITLKGKQCLEKADVVICDYLADKRLLAFAPENVEYIYVGKKAGNHAMRQEDISQLIADNDVVLIPFEEDLTLDIMLATNAQPELDDFRHSSSRLCWYSRYQPQSCRIVCRNHGA